MFFLSKEDEQANKYQKLKYQRIQIIQRNVNFNSGPYETLKVILGAREMALQLKSTGCSCRGAGFIYQHLHGSSQSSITPVAGNLMPFSGKILKYKK